MNVRFFAGTRAQYDSLPAPRNPLGLYFCADTQELFWADRLLTDGMRVVEKQSDLPAPDKAADGVVYYVNETRNGYVVPHGTNKWLQTIYAPLRKGESVIPGEEDNTVTTIGAVNDIVAQIYKDMDERIANINVGTSGSGVKVIEFAGYELEEVGDGNFIIDRRCARKALGFIVPDGLEDEEITIATKEYVDSQIAAITGTDLSAFVKQEDLEDYATKELVQSLIAEAELNSKPDLGNYYTKSETDIAIKSAVNAINVPNVSNLATKDELQEAINSIEHPLIDLTGYATKSFVEEKIAEIPGVDVDLSNYYTKTEVENLIPDVSNFATKDELPVVPTKVSELENDAGYLTQHQDLSDYAKKSELPSIEGLASEDFVRSEIAKAELNGGEVTEEELDNLLANYYNKTEVDNKFKDLEIPSIEGLATEEFVNKAIAGIEIPEAEIYKVDFNAPNFAEATEAYEAGKVLVLLNAAPDVNSYALMNYVSDKYITFTKFLMSRSETYGAFNTYYLSANNTWEVSKEVRLNKVEANVEGEPNGELTSIRIGKEIYKLPTVDLTGYATTESVETLAADVEHDRTQTERIAQVVERIGTEVAKLDASVVTQKYEVLPIEGMLIQYRDGEIRLNTQRVVPSLQQVGATGNPNMYYATFRAFAPEGATQCKEGLNGTMDAGYSELSTDAYGRKYTTIWAAIANTVDGGATWSKWGNTSTLEKYLGFYYHFEWYKGDVLIGKDKVRVILTNDTCHDDLVPDAVARRIDEKVATVNTTINNITNQVQNIEENYVTNQVLENYTTTEQLEQTFITKENAAQDFVTTEVLEEKQFITTAEAEEKIEKVVVEVVKEVVTPNSITYDTF